MSGLRKTACIVATATLLLLLAGCDPLDGEPGGGGTVHEAPTAEVATKGGPAAPRLPSLEAHASKLAPSDVEKMEGLEALNWKVERSLNSARVERVWLGEGGRKGKGPCRLAVELRGGEKEYSSVRCEGAWRLSAAKGAHTILVIYNDAGAAMRLSVAYSLGRRYEWHESLAAVLHPGWNTLRVDQSAATFMTRPTWQPRAWLDPAGDCRAVNLIFHNGRRSGRFFVEYLALELEAEPGPSNP
jgi:hypothetical protein